MIKYLVPANRYIRGSQEHLGRFGVAQEGGRARRESIGPGLEDHDQVPDIGRWQRDAVTKKVQRGAEPADDGHRLGGFLVHPVADRYRVVAPDYLPEIA